MALTIKPDAVLDGVGYAVVLSPEGDPLGAVVVRPSKTMPGYVTLISSHDACCAAWRAGRTPCG